MAERTRLPIELTKDVAELFALLPENPSSDDVRGMLASDQSTELLGQSLAEIRRLDPCFTQSGPGGFYRSDVTRAGAGRLKLHLFPSLEICDGDTGPHSHSATVISRVYAGTVENTTYAFTDRTDGDHVAEKFVAPAHLSRKVVTIGRGALDTLARDEIADNSYSVELGDIHTSATLSNFALTLCYFGPTVTEGVRYEPLGGSSNPAEDRFMSLRPKDIVG